MRLTVCQRDPVPLFAKTSKPDNGPRVEDAHASDNVGSFGQNNGRSVEVRFQLE